MLILKETSFKNNNNFTQVRSKIDGRLGALEHVFLNLFLNIIFYYLT